MTRLFVCVLAIVSFAMTASEALAEGEDHRKDVLARQGSNCVHGYAVNWTDTFYFAGDTAAFNKFIADYGKRDDLKRRVVIHVGTTNARSPWRQTDIPADWSFYIWNSGLTDPKNPAPSQVDVWLGSKIRLDELRIPDSVEVTSAGEVEKFIKDRGQKAPAAKSATKSP